MLKKLIVSFLLGCLFVVGAGVTSFAENDGQEIRERESDLTIQFKGSDKVIDKVKPTVYEPEIKPTVSTLLPKTNEIIQSLILLLIGISVIILTFGIIMFKKTYNKEHYAFY